MKRMFLLFSLLMLTATLSLTAQNIIPPVTPVYTPGHTGQNNIIAKDSMPAKKWFVSRYTGISSSISFFNGGSATVLSVPAGIQLNRRLSNNWYAFAGLSAAPSWINFNNSFLQTNTTKTFRGMSVLNNSRFNIFPKAEMGLMYINDKKTFSITGSISVQKSSYPWLSPTMGTGFSSFPIVY